MKRPVFKGLRELREYIVTFGNAQKIIFALTIFSLAANSGVNAWELSSRNQMLAATVETSLRTEALLEICANSELAAELRSALLLSTEYYIESRQILRQDFDDMLLHFQIKLNDFFSRVELSLDMEECDDIVDRSMFMIGSYIEAATHND